MNKLNSIKKLHRFRIKELKLSDIILLSACIASVHSLLLTFYCLKLPMMYESNLLMAALIEAGALVAFAYIILAWIVMGIVYY